MHDARWSLTVISRHSFNSSDSKVNVYYHKCIPEYVPHARSKCSDIVTKAEKVWVKRSQKTTAPSGQANVVLLKRGWTNHIWIYSKTFVFPFLLGNPFPHSWPFFITQVLNLLRWSCSQQGKVKEISWGSILYSVRSIHAGADEGLPLVYYVAPLTTDYLVCCIDYSICCVLLYL
jgi:hypothetical protein